MSSCDWQSWHKLCLEVAGTHIHVASCVCTWLKFKRAFSMCWSPALKCCLQHEMHSSPVPKMFVSSAKNVCLQHKARLFAAQNMFVCSVISHSSVSHKGGVGGRCAPFDLWIHALKCAMFACHYNIGHVQHKSDARYNERTFSTCSSPAPNAFVSTIKHVCLRHHMFISCTKHVCR